MVELMRKLEFSSQLCDLIVTAVMLVENLQRHREIRLSGGMCPVYSGVSTTPEGGVDDITLELHADRKHAPSLGRPGRLPFARMTSSERHLGANVVPCPTAAPHPSGFPPGR